MVQQKKTQKKKPAPAKKAPAVPTNEELLKLKETVDYVKRKGNNQFKLAMMDNEDLIYPEIRKLEELKQPSADFKKFQEEKRKLIFEYAELDEKGMLKMYSQPDGKGVRVYEPGPNSFFNIVKNKEEFEKKNEMLEKKYQKTLDEREQQMQEFQKTLQQPAKKLEFTKVNINQVPEMEYEHLKLVRKYFSKKS